MKKFLCYDTNDAASGKINVSSNGVLSPNATVPSTNGASYQQLVTDGDGNTKWEDRLAYESDPVLTTLIEELTVVGGEGQVEDERTVDVFYKDLRVGTITHIVYDGVSYECEVKAYGDNKYIGNIGIAGADNTGEPFVILWESGIMIVAADDGEHNISVSYEKRDVHKIDEKYLPDTAVISEYAECIMPCIDLCKATNLATIFADRTNGGYTSINEYSLEDWKKIYNLIYSSNVFYADSCQVVSTGGTDRTIKLVGSIFNQRTNSIEYRHTVLHYDETNKTITVTYTDGTD